MLLRDRLFALKWSKKYKADYDRYEEYRQQNGVLDSFATDGGPSVSAFTVSEEGKKLCSKYGIPYPFSPYGDDLPDEIRIDLDIPAAVVAQTIPGTLADVMPSGTKLQFMIEIDTTKSETRIIEEFVELYRRLKDIAMMAEREGRETSSTPDDWKIYALHRQGKSMAQIRRDMFGIKEHPAYDREADRYHHQIKRAIEKAEKLLNEFDRDIPIH
jgi:hypothetical protein